MKNLKMGTATIAAEGKTVVPVSDLTEEQRNELDEKINELENHYIIPGSNDPHYDIREQILLTLDVLINAIFGHPDIEGYEDVIVYAYLDGLAQNLSKEYSLPLFEISDMVIDEMIICNMTGLEGWKEYYRESIENPEWREHNLEQYWYWDDHIKWKPVFMHPIDDDMTD